MLAIVTGGADVSSVGKHDEMQLGKANTDVPLELLDGPVSATLKTLLT